jgi:hypothetical protein
MSEPEPKFWVEDPCILLTDLNFIPCKKQSLNSNLNALTRSAIVAAVVLYLFNYTFWLTFLLIALLVIIVLKYMKKEHDSFQEGFSVVPTYQGLDMQQTTVAPMFSEEWQIYPPAYDLYENLPPPVTFEEPLKPQSYPYGQYLTTTNLLPSDEEHTRMLNGSVRDAREYANSSFLRHDLAYRENMSRIYKKSLARRFRNNCNDTFSSYSSY